jgi:predicted NAD-dependent protein-ADP-ribosyltransferase YbiA (DUF1768 family)
MVVVQKNMLDLLKQKPNPVQYQEIIHRTQHTDNDHDDNHDNEDNGKPMRELLLDHREMEKSRIHRKDILDVLREKKVLVGPCEDEVDEVDEDEQHTNTNSEKPTPESYSSVSSTEKSKKSNEDPDVVRETSEPTSKKLKMAISLEEEDADADAEEVDANAKSDTDELVETSDEDIIEPKEPTPREPVGFPQKNNQLQPITSFSTDTIFVLCANASKQLPGKATGETLDKNDPSLKTNYKTMVTVSPNWRMVLCNTHETPFKLDGTQWESVDHYMIATKYLNQSTTDDTVREALQSSYKSAQTVDKKGKVGKTKLTIDDDFTVKKSQYMYDALYEKFSQDTNNLNLQQILFFTLPAKLRYRPTAKTIEDFDELMSLRQQMTPYLQYTYGEQPTIAAPKPRKTTIAPPEPPATTTPTDEDPINIQIALPEKREKIVMKAPSYYMNNRADFFRKIKQLFSKHKHIREKRDGVYEDSNDLMVHQRVVIEYLNTYSPYRGLLIYHGLGSGKTYTSIAVAEGMKDDRQIVVLLPASLHTNYSAELESFSQLQQFGDPVYKKNQYWNFIKTEDKPQMVDVFSKSFSLPEKWVRDKGGVWAVDVQKPANYNELPPDSQEDVNEQIKYMIESKYRFIHYNANNVGKQLDKIRDERNVKNPFDNSVVIVDEAHNLISNIKNKLPLKTGIVVQLYKWLMDAENTRIVLLSGTPIVNHPHEMGILYNILRGFIHSWEFDIQQTTGQVANTLFVEKLLDKHNLHYYDFVDYTRGKLVITRNPFGFVNLRKGQPRLPEPVAQDITTTTTTRQTKRGRKPVAKTTRKKKPVQEPQPQPQPDNSVQEYVGGSSDDFIGVYHHPDGFLSNKEFIQKVTKCLNQNGLQVKKTKTSSFTALPDKMDDFQKRFVKQVGINVSGNNDILHRNVLYKRILGLTSYFRSPKEGLMPSFVLTENGNEIHEIRCEMSSSQFTEYAKMRTEERKREENAKKKNRVKKQQNQIDNHETLNANGNYRSASRLCCNFFIPDDPGRPRMMEIDDDETEIVNSDEEEDDNDNVDVDTDADANDENKGKSVNMKRKKEIYKKEIERTTKVMGERKDEFFRKEILNTYSPKFSEILSRIQDPANRGPHLVYSDFLNLEGLMFIKYSMEANNMRELKIERRSNDWRLVDYDTPENAGKPAFIMYTGDEDTETKEILRNIYNGIWSKVPDAISTRLQKVSPDHNKYGDIVKAFMITKAGAEGINLKNTRFVHITEPYWHKTRLDQVIGRARRIGSHLDLPTNMQTVQVFLYLSVFSESQMKSHEFKELMTSDLSKIDPSHAITTDEYLYELAVMKQHLIDQFLHVIKESAVDCRLYRSSHKEKFPLVCYGNTNLENATTEETNEFISHPKLDVDIADDPETVARPAPTTTKQGRKPMAPRK